MCAGAETWTKTAGKYCTSSGSPFRSASAAKAGCAASSSCSAIYDSRCDGVGSFYMCKANSVKTSSVGSCVYKYQKKSTGVCLQCVRRTPAF